MRRAQILIVEDEAIVAADIQDRLKALGYGVVGLAPSADEARQLAGDLRPDLVLMDIMLKGAVDGVQAAEHIRAAFDIPVVYLTAHADETTLQRAKVTAPFGYILKPFEDRELHTTVEIALYRHESEARLKRVEQWLTTVLQSIGDAVVATDKWGLITWLNPTARVLTGWQEEEAAGRALAEVFRLIDPLTRQAADSPLHKVVFQGATVEGTSPLLLVARDGSQAPVDYIATPLRDDQGSISGSVIVFRNIQARRQVEQNRDKLAADLREAQRQVQTLMALFPVCPACRKPRRDQGYWQQVEAYLQAQADPKSGHPLCPECAKGEPPPSR